MNDDNGRKGTTLVRALAAVITSLLLFALPACTREEAARTKGETTIVFKHGKIAGDAAQFRAILDRFEHEHPGITVKDETLPASTDEQHQFYAINLEGKSADFDVLALDVIWVQEFARAGWLRDVSGLLGEGERGAFFPGPIQADTFEDRLYALPWYVDAGVLYYRSDLLRKYRQAVPKTWPELVKAAETVTAKEKDLYGFIWQGKQYEGLVCNVLEYLWGNGGDVLAKGRVVLDSPANEAALSFMHDLISRYGVTPPLVTTSIEEPTRHLFEGGKAVFMRNWPYAWNIFQRQDSPVRGDVGVAPLPSFPGHPSASTLGGWQLGINRYSRNQDAAEKLILFLTSPAAQKELVREQPFMTSLYGVLMNARPRPVTPSYMAITQVLQPAFSAVLAGARTPEEALSAAQSDIERILSTDSGSKAERGRALR
jgi:multiple sugar transport system substrate-binding protein